jgi:hypothetical protein
MWYNALLAGCEIPNMAKVYDIRTRQRKGVSGVEFFELLTTLEKDIEQLRSHRINQNGLDNAMDIVHLMKWNGLYNPKFRDEYTEPLERLLDDLYIELNTKK